MLAALALGLVALLAAAARGGAADLRADGRHPRRADGLEAEDAVKLVTEPLETIVKASTASSTSIRRPATTA
jgi:hypothetical protein